MKTETPINVGTLLNETPAVMTIEQIFDHENAALANRGYVKIRNLVNNHFSIMTHKETAEKALQRNGYKR